MFNSTNANVVLPDSERIDESKVHKWRRETLRLKKKGKPPMLRNVLSILGKVFINILPPSATRIHMLEGEDEGNNQCTTEQLAKEWDSLRIHQVLPRTDMYEHLISNTNEPLLYNIDVLVSKDNDANRIGSVGSSMHHVVINYVINDIDRVELNLGPVVGQVTKTTANIMFEVNRNLRELVCEVRSKSDVLKARAKALRLQQIQTEKKKQKELEIKEVERPKSRAELRAERREKLNNDPRYARICTYTFISMEVTLIQMTDHAPHLFLAILHTGRRHKQR